MKTKENSPDLWREKLPKLSAEANKYSRGYAMLYGGYPITGAARLAALACARSGAGLTSILVPSIALPVYASTLLSIMVKPYDIVEQMQTLADDKRVNAYLIGPGAGISEQTKQATLYLLSKQKPVVIDAGAISVFENNPAELCQAIKHPCILTPHQGELKRLFNLTDDRTASASQAAKSANAIVVLKGHHTIIASPQGQIAINQNAPPTLATAGSGDVLAGIITSLLAQGMPAFESACAGVWLHAEAANLFGLGLIAEDLPMLVVEVLRKLSNR